MTYIPVDINESVKKECNRRRLSQKTAKTYLFCINRFLKWGKKELGKISKKDVRIFLEHLADKGLSGNSLNTYHMAIRFLFLEVLNKKMWIDIKYSKVPKTLPVVLTKDEINRLFENIKNKKHKLIVELMYSAGLRVNELVNLKVMDFEFDKNYGWVRKGKGNKDRLFIIAQKLNKRLQEFIQENKLNYESYLFKGNKINHISKETVNQIIKNSAKKAGIKKRVHCHTLRHSFATHLIEDGYSVNDVQSLLGHKSLETTMVYVHMASPKMINIKSPLDNL